MSERVAAAITAIACLAGNVAPQTLVREVPVIVYLEKPAPAMWLACTPEEFIERRRACFHREQSQRTSTGVKP